MKKERASSTVAPYVALTRANETSHFTSWSNGLDFMESLWYNKSTGVAGFHDSWLPS